MSLLNLSNGGSEISTDILTFLETPNPDIDSMTPLTLSIKSLISKLLESVKIHKKKILILFLDAI